MQAPVRVAMSTIQLGFSCWTKVSASHSTSRPSASVFRISMVWPDMLVTTSPGLVARPEGMFSAQATTATMFRGKSNCVTACITPMTVAAPPMSYFISSMPAPGFRLIPPVSKVMPLPTKAIGASSPPLLKRMTASWLSWSEPCPTDSRLFIPS